METDKQLLRFKTNINCGGCVSTVKPYLDQTEEISHWEVDTKNPDKLLSVYSSGITREQVMEIVQKAGFKIESLSL